MSEVPEDVERWTAGRRLALVTEILAGKLSVQEAARQHGLTVADVEEWKDRALEGAKNALRSRPKDDERSESSARRSCWRRSVSSRWRSRS